jgi:hypothetical protein
MTPTPGARANPATIPAPGTFSAPASSANSAIPPTAARIAALKTPAASPSALDIRAAKAQGLVWVDFDTKLFHTPGDQEYGTTKNGKFLDEDDAKTVGAHMATH